MKEMRLFEVGFKEKPHNTGYSYKTYVGADKAENAIIKAREWVIGDIDEWWYTFEELTPEEEEKAKQKELERLNNLPLARVQDLGTLII